MPRRSRRIASEELEEEEEDGAVLSPEQISQEEVEVTQPDEAEEEGPALPISNNQASMDNYFFSQLSAREREVASSYGIKLCKAAMAAELRNQVITKGYIQKYVLGDERGIKFSHVFRYAQMSLDMFGFELVPLPSKDQKEIDPAKIGQFLNSSFIVRSTLPNKFQHIIGDYFVKISNDDWETPNSFGPVLLVICCIALHKNNISKKELEVITQKFGLVDTSLEETLSKAIKEEYIIEERISNGEKTRKRRRKQNGEDDEFIQYHIGRRTRLEFGKQRTLKFLEELYGDTFDEQRAQVSLSWWEE